MSLRNIKNMFSKVSPLKEGGDLASRQEAAKEDTQARKDIMGARRQVKYMRKNGFFRKGPRSPLK